MGEQFRRYEVTGMIKFYIDDAFEDNLQDLKKRLQNPDIFICDDIYTANEHGDVEIIFSEIEDLGLCDMDEFYAQRKRKAEKAPDTETPKQEAQAQ